MNHWYNSKLQLLKNKLQRTDLIRASNYTIMHTLISRRNLVVAGVGESSLGEELFLNQAGAGESSQDIGATGLVVGTTGTGTTERLLADQSSGGLAVDVEVTGRVTESILSLTDGTAVLGEDSTGQGETTTGLVDLLQGGGPFGIGVDVDGQDGSEDLLIEELVVGRVDLVDSRVDVVTDGAVVVTTGNQLNGGILVAAVDDRLDLLEGAAVDDRAHECLKVLVGVTHGNLLDTSLELGKEFLGARLGQIDTGSGRALLALVFKGTTDGVVDSAGDIRSRVDEVEVLAAGLGDDTRKLAVGLVGDTLANAAVQGTENVGRSDEVQTSKVAVGEGDISDSLGVTSDELDNVRRQTGLQEDVVDEVAGIDVGGRGLPDNDVTHKSRS